MRRVGIALLMLLVIAAGGASAGVSWRVLNSAPFEQPTRWPILLQQANGNLVLADQIGRSTPLTTDADGRGNVYLYPTPAPDGQSVALVAVRHSGATPSAALEVHRLDGQRTTIYDQPNSSPFYLSWSPDSNRIAFLAGGAGGGFELYAAGVTDGSDAKQIAPGQPSYFAWSPNGQRLLMRIGGSAPQGSLQLYEWGADKPQPLSAAPAGFQAPDWLPDGQHGLVVVQRDTGAALATIDGSGAIVRELAPVARSTIFVAAPDAQRIAHLAFSNNRGELRVLDLADGSNDLIGSASVVTMLWSPSGQSLAFLSIVGADDAQQIAYTEQQRGPQLQWNVFDLPTGEVRELVRFEPTEQFINLLPFFDQYAQSHRLWDRSGRQVLYASPEGVFALDVVSGQSQRVGDGVLGLWME